MAPDDRILEVGGGHGVAVFLVISIILGERCIAVTGQPAVARKLVSALSPEPVAVDLRTVSGRSSNTILGGCRRSMRPPVGIRAYFA